MAVLKNKTKGIIFLLFQRYFTGSEIVFDGTRIIGDNAFTS